LPELLPVVQDSFKNSSISFLPYIPDYVN
jgi:hypothetical protein